MGCAETPTLSKVQKPEETLTLDTLERAPAIDIANIPGKNPSEQLMYLLGIPDATKGALLVSLDTNIEVMRQTGATEQADVMQSTRRLFIQAADENMDMFLEIAADVYAQKFTPEEIERLIVLYSDPVLQKMTFNQIELMSDTTGAVEQWAEIVGGRYAELVEEQGQ